MKLEKFMWCMTLETIGLTIGFFGVFIGINSLLSLIGGFFYLLWMLMSTPSEEHQQENDVSGLVKLIMVGTIFAIIVISVFTHMHVLLIKGIRNKQHEKIKPWLVFHGIGIAMSLLKMLSFLGGRVPILFMALDIVGFAFFIYCYMAVHSLFENIKETSQRGLLTNEQTAGISMPPAYSIAEGVEQSQMDFDYMKLV